MRDSRKSPFPRSVPSGLREEHAEPTEDTQSRSEEGVSGTTPGKHYKSDLWSLPESSTEVAPRSVTEYYLTM